MAPPDGPALRVIGRIRTPWAAGNCPRNIAAARDSGQGARIDLDPAFAPALQGLAVGQPIIVLYWMDQARRDLLRQAPRHVASPRGTFALRSPNRPNTISQSTVIVTALDIGAATLEIDAIDCFDGTALIDIKPWRDTVDLPPGFAK
ncbi:MAG: SAM-dependent methyltransferase [Rhodobacteraceae bacterium]|nr:SAM-dependent methyltransferase [Paracoccaceae bacterium]